MRIMIKTELHVVRCGVEARISGRETIRGSPPSHDAHVVLRFAHRQALDFGLRLLDEHRDLLQRLLPCSNSSRHSIASEVRRSTNSFVCEEVTTCGDSCLVVMTSPC